MELDPIRSLARGHSTLSLLMAGIAAHDMDDAAAPYDLAFIANPLDACSYFHDNIQTEFAGCTAPASVYKLLKFHDLQKL